MNRNINDEDYLIRNFVEEKYLPYKPGSYYDAKYSQQKIWSKYSPQNWGDSHIFSLRYVNYNYHDEDWTVVKYVIVTKLSSCDEAKEVKCPINYESNKDLDGKTLMSWSSPEEDVVEIPGCSGYFKIVCLSGSDYRYVR